LISASEAYDYTLSIDNPVMSESSPNLSKNIFLPRCVTMLKVKKETKEWKEMKEWAEPKQVIEPKAYEGPELMDPYEQFSEAFDELESDWNGWSGE